MEALARILVVDDDPDVAEPVAAALRRSGYEVSTAATGNEAIAVAAAFMPDAVLLDVLLPDINGITLAAILRATVDDPELRIVGFSGSSADKLRQATDRHLFDECVSKPATFEQIESALAGRHH